MARFVVLAAVAALLFAASLVHSAPVTAGANIAFSGNVTLNNATQTGTLSFRGIGYQAVNVGPLNFLLSEAIAGSATGNAQGGSAVLDIVTSGFMTGLGAPFGFILYFDDHTKWIIPTGTPNLLAITGSAQAAGGIAAVSYTKIDEVNAAGTVVNTVQMSSLQFTQHSGVQVLTDSTGNIKYNWVAATLNGATYNFTMLHSSVLGKIAYGATVTPKSSDVILEIDNYPYANAANHLRLTFTAAFGVLNWQGQATVTANGVSTGNGPNSVYINAQGQASISGTMTNVNVNVQAKASGDVDALANAIVNSIASGNKGYTVTTVDFPAGAAQIIYDPAAGFEPPSSGVALRASVFLVAIAVMVAFFTGKSL